MFGTNSPINREKLINVGRDLTLQKAIQIGKNNEYAREQMTFTWSNRRQPAAKTTIA